jgi:hypothetical protein
MPQAPEILEAYGQLQRFLGQATMEAVHAAVTRPWKEVHLEISTSTDGKTGGVRVRVVPESSALIDVPLTQPIVSAAAEIWKFRNSGITPNWRSMRLLITSEGQCTVNFDYAD